uniref:isopeptide-forming domain-containing fimbrial protein n=1 Tax=Gemmiger formicilis TaxID=745368 RepID=UPI003FEE0036
MKTLKKAMSVLVSLLMIFTFALPAFADSATTYTITAPATTHQYEIYQIFTGDLSEGILSNVKWGVNGTGTKGEAVASAVIDELTAVNSRPDSEKLDVVKKYAKLDSTPVATITNGATYSAAAGYYLIKDKDNTVSGADTYTTYIVKVVGNVTITPKSNVPSFEKKVKDTNDTTGATSDWQDSADYDIGDEVPFKLEGTVASNYADYKTYYFAFHDQAEDGLTFNKDSVKVYVDTTEINTGYKVVTSTTDGDTFDVVFDNLKNIADVKANSKITVEYTATLNDKAVLGNQGNVNTAHLEFSNNPNEEQNGSNKPETGNTPEDSVIVFTYQVVVNKVKADGEALTGAEFTLEKVLENGTQKTVAVVKNADGTTFTFKGLDDGDYILTETVTPATYNTIEPIRFTVTADHKITWNGEARNTILTSLTGNVTSGTADFMPDKTEGSLTTNVVNQSGATLPGTGGIGTTIFYVIGGLLMAAAAVLLITKKRMNSDK